MLARALLSLCAATIVACATAAEAPSAPLSPASLEALVSNYFPGAKPIAGQGVKLPSHRVADFDGDGKPDLVAPFTDEETTKRGPGCYGLGIVTSYDDPGAARRAFQLYNCFGEYSVEVREFIPIKVGGKEQRMPLESPRPCVRMILKYGDRDFICHNHGRFESMYSTPRLQATADVLETADIAGAPDSLAAARVLWSNAAPASYSYVVKRSTTVVTNCRVRRTEFLPMNPVRVSVRAGAVKVATMKGRSLPDTCFGDYYRNLHSIDGLFNLVELEEKQTNPTGKAPCIKVTFDATFGYPTKIDGDCYLDGDFPIEVTDFRRE